MIEVTFNSIREGVISILSRSFPGMKVYGEEIKQGFKAPCFFVKLLNGAQEHEFNRRYKRSHPFDIHFFPGDMDYNVKAHDMADKLYETFKSININGAMYKGKNMTHEIVDGVLHFFVDYNFHVFEPKDNIPKMKTLEQEGYLKNG